MASRGQTSLAMREERGERGASSARIAPLYKRLPHGPHRLGRAAVIRHQRARIHGAMIEAVDRSGYWGASVKQVIGLAGVSRRSFYEQFANKQECFLATFDLLAGRALRQTVEAYLAVDGVLEDRLAAVFGELTGAAAADPKAARLLVLEAQTAGAAGTLRQLSAIATCEQLISRSFAESDPATALPRPIVRGIAGGLHGALSSRLREERAAPGSHIAGELLRWTLCFQTPRAARLTERLSARSAARLREVFAARRDRPLGPEGAPAGDRERLLERVLRLVVLEDYRDLSVAQIAEEAGVSIDGFFELFADRSDCFLAALDMLGEELLAIAADGKHAGAGWAQGVRRAIGGLMVHLAEHPLRARCMGQAALAAGPEAVQRNLELSQRLARALSAGAPLPAGAPVPAGEGVLLEGVGGAILHTVRCQAAGGRIELLPALSDHLAYVVLAPFIGADAALEAVIEEPTG